MDKAAKTSLVDLLRHVHIEATAEITEPNGWSYHTIGLGRTMHKAADRIEELSEKTSYEYLVAVVKDAIMSECDGTMLHDRFEDGVRLPEMFDKQIEEFAERIATEIYSKLK